MLLYNGQLDVIVGAPLTERFLQVLEWSGKSEYLKAEKKIWKIGTDVAGYVRAVKNFYQVSSYIGCNLTWYDAELISPDSDAMQMIHLSRVPLEG